MMTMTISVAIINSGSNNNFKFPVFILGLLGPDRTEDAIVVSRFLSSLPSSRRLLLLSGSATGEELTDRNLFSNFFRVIPPDSIQVQVSAS